MATNHISKDNRSDPTMQSAFRPPAVLTIAATAAKSLDRSQFAKKVQLPRAVVRDNRVIGEYRSKLQASNDLLKVARISPVQKNAEGDRWLLLNPGIDLKAPDTWSPTLSEAVKAGDLRLDPWELNLDYGFWGYCESRLGLVGCRLDKTLTTRKWMS